MTSEIPVYPASLVLEGRPCLVVGGGRIAARKVEGLLAAGADVTVVAPSIVDAIRSLPVRREQRPYRRGEAGGYRLVITATGVAAVDRTVFADAERSGVFVNAADDPDACSFLVPAIVRRGPVTIAVSTGGVSPALAAWLKARVAEAVGPDVETLAALLGRARSSLRRRGVSTEGLDWASLIARTADLLGAGRARRPRSCWTPGSTRSSGACLLPLTTPDAVLARATKALASLRWRGRIGTSVHDMAVPGVDMSRVPTHVACVMDGNGRWARKRGLPRTEGHGAGEEALFDVVDGALDLGLRWLTMYAFSTENWRRPADEVRYLMHFNEGILTRHRDEMNEKGVRIRFAGRRDWRVPRRVARSMEESAALTEHNRRLTLTIAFNYGGRAEIVDAVRRIVEDGVQASKIDERTLHARLYWPDMPDPDLVDPNFRRVPHLELLAVGARLLRAAVLRRPLAGLPP